MKNRILLSLALATAVAACGGDSVDETISGVVPGDVFAGRTATVLISGSATSWGDGVTVDFGAGITVDNLVVASPTALSVDVTIDGTAELGSRDVTVTDGGSDLTYAGAFSVISPLQVISSQGTTAQGSVVFYRVQSLDFTTPFDTTATGGGLFSAPEFTNIEIAVPGGVSAQVSNVDPYTLDFALLIDVDATAGAVDLDIQSGPADGARTSFILPAAIDIATREAVALDAGGTADGSIEAAFDSVLYKVTVGGANVASASVTTSDANAAPGVFVLPSSGSFADALGFDVELAGLADGDFYVVVWDNSGAAGFDYTVSAGGAVIGATTAAESEPNDSKGQAQAVAAPLTVTDCSLADDTDEDWYEITIAAGDAGKSLGVATSGPANTDTVIEVFEADGTTSVTGPIDINFHEAVVTPPLDAGTYYAVVTNTGGFFTPSPGPYTLSLGLTP